VASQGEVRRPLVSLSSGNQFWRKGNPDLETDWAGYPQTLQFEMYTHLLNVFMALDILQDAARLFPNQAFQAALWC
jgi:hypothetical protein